MQGRAVRHGTMSHVHLCQAEDKDTYMRFLEGGLPLESQLLHSDQLRQWYKHHRSRGHISSEHEGVQALSLTFLAQRIVSITIAKELETSTFHELLTNWKSPIEHRDGVTAVDILTQSHRTTPWTSVALGILTSTLFYSMQ
jgi:hypothetical protein